MCLETDDQNYALSWALRDPDRQQRKVRYEFLIPISWPPWHFSYFLFYVTNNSNNQRRLLIKLTISSSIDNHVCCSPYFTDEKTEAQRREQELVLLGGFELRPFDSNAHSRTLIS